MELDELYRKFHIDFMGSLSPTQTNPVISDSSVILLELLETSGLLQFPDRNQAFLPWYMVT